MKKGADVCSVKSSIRAFSFFDQLEYNMDNNVSMQKRSM